MSLFKPNLDCVIVLPGERNGYGQVEPGRRVRERCSATGLMRRAAPSTVRADSSGSRGAAEENLMAGRVRLAANTVAVVDAVIEVDGLKLKVKGLGPRHALTGVIDHFVAEVAWSAQ